MTFSVQMVTMVISLFRLIRKLCFVAELILLYLTLCAVASVHWSDVVHMCVLTDTTTTYIAVWASPVCETCNHSQLSLTHLLEQITFEILVLVSTVWNALDRPRGAGQRFIKALYRDGITYLFVCACCGVRLQSPTLTSLYRYI